MTPPTNPLIPLGDGHTPLGDDDRQGLKLTYVTTRDELNEAEQENILRARQGRRPPTVEALLDDKYLRDLHRAMFGDVWTWAGQYRQLEMSIGIDPVQIAVSVRDLVSDTKIWIASEEPLIAAVRFHHRLVWIHPFSNGNGRHGRLAADYLIVALGQPPLTWGAFSGARNIEQVRQQYLIALRAADRGDFGPLEEFVVT
ncbi:MAG: mobile mystery protein B [Actinomycetota bacterium]